MGVLSLYLHEERSDDLSDLLLHTLSGQILLRTVYHPRVVIFDDLNSSTGQDTEIQERGKDKTYFIPFLGSWYIIIRVHKTYGKTSVDGLRSSFGVELLRIQW